MSYEIFVYRFIDGHSVPIPASIFEESFLAIADRRDPEFDFWHIRAADNGEADIYAKPDRDGLTSVMISRCKGEAILDLIAEFARRADAVIILPGCATALTNATQRRHLPPDLADSALVHDGSGISTLLASG